jgi:hypothetical protein
VVKPKALATSAGKQAAAKAQPRAATSKPALVTADAGDWAEF